MFTWNLSPLQSSKLSFEYLLLPLRSVLMVVSINFKNNLQNGHYTLLQNEAFKYTSEGALASFTTYRFIASVPSIFRANSFGR